MVKLYNSGAYLVKQTQIIADSPDALAQVARATGKTIQPDQAKKGAISYSIIQGHNTGSGDDLRLTFDSLTSHDITCVGIIQTARASGMQRFPLPYVLTNCHNSLCAVGGTVNEDDHKFALSAAEKYGGVYVPANLAVVHTYNREQMAFAGGMVLGSDSHTRYGALGALGVGEGGGELAKQLVGRTYDVTRPGVVGVYLAGKPQKGVGPHDVALALVGAVCQNGYVKNKIMEFVGPGVGNLSVEFRNGVDVMTTETTCWSSVWKTDGKVREYFEIHGRPGAYKELKPADITYYDGMIEVDLSAIEPTIAMPFHPGNVYTIRELKANAGDILAKVQKECLSQVSGSQVELDLLGKIKNGDIWVDQGVIAGCAGGIFDNICAAADILDCASTGNGAFSLSVYPGSQPAYLELVKNGSVANIMAAGGIVHTAFCGPCFGAGDTPANGEFSIRHTTRNFPNREGSMPGEGQLSAVALMDARSIAATAANGGRLTAATEIDAAYRYPKFYFDKGIYQNRVLDRTGNPNPATELRVGPNIKDWPAIPALTGDVLLKVVCRITDPVTTTDELIPSGETSSYRSNPLRLAEFTLSRRDPAYVGEAKAVHAIECARRAGRDPTALSEELRAVYQAIKAIPGCEAADPKAVGFGSTIYANKPGDGSAREQAASCQRVLGGWANLAQEYATRRYRSNLINWGMVPLLLEDGAAVGKGDYLFLPGLRRAVLEGTGSIKAYVIRAGACSRLTLSIGELTGEERKILAAGCLINHYRNQIQHREETP